MNINIKDPNHLLLVREYIKMNFIPTKNKINTVFGAGSIRHLIDRHFDSTKIMENAQLIEMMKEAGYKIYNLTENSYGIKTCCFNISMKSPAIKHSRDPKYFWDYQQKKFIIK